MSTDSRMFKHTSADLPRCVPHDTQHPVFHMILHTIFHSRWTSFGIIFTVIDSIVASLLPPLVLAKLIDQLTLGVPLSRSMVILYFLLVALSGILDSARESLLTVLGQKITHGLRSCLSAKLSHLSADILTRQEPGAVASRFVGDVDTVQMLFTSGIISMFADACKMISILIIIWMKNRGLALLLLILLPLVFLFTQAVQKRMLTAQIANRAAVSRATNHVPETIRCIRTIHTLGREKYMKDKYDEYIESSYKAMDKTNFYDAVYSPVILILNAAAVAMVLLLSASGNPVILSLFGMSVGTAVAVIHYISQVFSPIESLGMEIQTIQSALAGVHRIEEFLEQPQREVPRLSKPGYPDSTMPISTTTGAPSDCPSDIVCEFRDVVFGYDKDHIILNHLSFTIHSGEQVTLSGRTGAGKSTIFKLLLGLYEPQSGAVFINGTPAAQISDTDRRKVFGYVEQSFHLVPGTILDQITLFDGSISQKQVRDAAELVGLHETISHMEQGYDTPCTPSLFSQGQWQLLSIARAIAAEPRILLLDEITANLDAETEQTVLHALSRAAAHRTVISISHRIYGQNGGRMIEI